MALRPPARRQRNAPEGHKVGRVHRLNDAHLLDEQLLDLEDALHAVDDDHELALIDVIAHENLDDGLQLVEDLLEPQLIDLVDHDEQMLLVGLLAALGALRLDRRKKRVHLEVIAIVATSAVVRALLLLGHG